MIVTVTPTICDGTVVRWYRDTDPLSDLPAVEPVISASHNGVRVGTYLHEVPADVMAAAQATFDVMRRDRAADVSHLATHHRRGLFGPVEPIARQEAS